MGVHTFPKGICLKVNIIARLEFELAYYDSAARRFNHDTTTRPSYTFSERIIIINLYWKTYNCLKSMKSYECTDNFFKIEIL